MGKDSVLMRMRELGFPFHFVVTANSRPQRPGEIDGVDYHFVTTERFREMIENDELLEWAEVYGQYKGIPKFEIRQAMASGRDVILRINVDGAATIKRLAPEAVFIFLAPASLDELRHRLLLRRTESPAEVERRLAWLPMNWPSYPISITSLSITPTDLTKRLVRSVPLLALKRRACTRVEFPSSFLNRGVLQ